MTPFLTSRACFLTGFLFLSLLGGCASPHGRTGTDTRDKAFIQYWPPPPNAKGPRIAVKDLIDMKGLVTTAGSEFLEKNSPPAKQDAACLAITRERGVPIVGKTNVTELAVGVSGINEYYGTPVNPLGRHLIPGGSSCGSAVAVANGTADIALGTDTAGSIRVPAACCGIVGLKTTYQLVPIKGVYPIAPTNLDTVGPMARDVAGVAQGMDLLQRGFASRYRSARAARPAAAGITVGRLYVKGTDSKIDRALDAALAAAGFRVVTLGDAFREKWERAEKDGRTVAAACAWEYDQQFNHQPGVTLRTKAVFALGALQYKTAYPKALLRRGSWSTELDKELSRVDFIALPTLKRLTPRIGLLGGTPAFEAAVLAMQNTVAVNLAGNPALALPLRLERGSAVTSLQLIGKRFGEAELLNAGRLFEAR